MGRILALVLAASALACVQLDPPNLTCEWQETDRLTAPAGQCVRLTALDANSGVSFGEESCSEVQSCVALGPGDVATFYARASRLRTAARVKVERWDCSYPAPCASATEPNPDPETDEHDGDRPKDADRP